MSIVKHMREKLGEERMSKPASRNELFEMVDLITDTLRSHKERLDELEDEATRPRPERGDQP